MNLLEQLVEVIVENEITQGVFGVKSLFARQNLQGKPTFKKQYGQRNLTTQPQLQRKLNENAYDNGEQLREKTLSKMSKSHLPEVEDRCSKMRTDKKGSISSLTTKVVDDLGLMRICSENEVNCSYRRRIDLYHKWDQAVNRVVRSLGRSE
ncbi:hypothetical protein Cadr_000010247 [Camelus dromedarius]|uniref:Uncharacterized protein n=1 Tax=Camelus dromedarius TaxID=9838 RepID=A0A5N4DXC8_CAMDR|nr:hypothetical protein Cadr_000010247 [Camelus dromedarius]